MAKTATSKTMQHSQLAAAVQAVVGSAPVMQLDAAIPTLPALPATIGADDVCKAEFSRGAITKAEFLIKMDGLHANADDAKSLGYRWSKAEQEQRIIVARLAVLLKSADFPTFETIRLAFVAGQLLRLADTSNDPQGAADTAWNRAIGAVKKAFPNEKDWFKKPKSSKSSATRVLSPEAQAKADKAKAERERIEGMDISEIKAEIKGERDDVKRAALYIAKAKKEKAAADAAGKVDKAERDKLIKAIDEGIESLTTAQVRSILTAVNKLLAAK